VPVDSFARLTGRVSHAYALNIGSRAYEVRNVTRADLIEEVSRAVDLTRKESETIIDSIFDGIVKALRRGEKTELRGFGTFRTRQRRPRIGRNPKTGARVEVPAKKIPYFNPSKELKDLVNNTARVR
jgi:integration host factor subunit beta